MRVAVVDDMPIVREALENKLKELFAEEILAVEIKGFQDGLSFLQSQKENPFQVVFLDIFMPNLDGLTLAGKLREMQENIIIVFCTSDDSCVFDSIKFNPFRYIRKDYLDQELQEVVPALLNEINYRQNRIVIKTNQNVFSVYVKDIIYFESKGHYLYVYLNNKVISYKGKLNTKEEELSHLGFIRVHMSYLVNAFYIFRVGVSDIIMENGVKIPMSRHRSSEVKEKFQEIIRRSSFL